MNKLISILFLSISLTFASVDVVIELQKDSIIKSYKATFYNQAELPSGVDSNSIDSLGISHIYLIAWGYPNFYFKSDILTGNLLLTKEKLEEKINDLDDIKNINLEKLNEPISDDYKINSLVFDEN